MLFETNRLIMRDPQKSDFAAYFHLVQDEQATAWGAFGYQRPQTLTEAKSSFEKYYLDPLLGCAVLDKSNQQLIGVLTMMFSEFLGTWEVGYIFHSDYWHQGLATEATRGALCHLFEEQSAPYVFAELVAENQASEHVLQRCQFTYEGLARNAFNLRGVLRNQKRYGMTAAEFQQLRGSHQI